MKKLSALEKFKFFRWAHPLNPFCITFCEVVGVKKAMVKYWLVLVGSAALGILLHFYMTGCQIP